MEGGGGQSHRPQIRPLLWQAPRPKSSRPFTPEAFPLLHIKRDVAILLDGTVPLCREDTERTHPLGNVFVEDLAAIWERGVAFYKNHIDEAYPSICRECDEYYTFNF